MGIKDIAQKRKLHVYSWDEGYFSSGLKADPPEEFISFLIKKTGLTLKNGVASCGDINPNTAKNEEISNKNYLRIHWKSGDLVAAICEDCAKTKKNTM